MLFSKAVVIAANAVNPGSSECVDPRECVLLLDSNIFDISHMDRLTLTIRLQDIRLGIN